MENTPIMKADRDSLLRFFLLEQHLNTSWDSISKNAQSIEQSYWMIRTSMKQHASWKQRKLDVILVDNIWCAAVCKLSKLELNSSQPTSTSTYWNLTRKTEVCDVQRSQRIPQVYLTLWIDIHRAPLRCETCGIGDLSTRGIRARISHGTP